MTETLLSISVTRIKVSKMSIRWLSTMFMTFSSEKLDVEASLLSVKGQGE